MSRRCQPIPPGYGKYCAMSPDRLTFNQLDDDVAAGRVQRVGSVHHRDISPISDTVEAYLATASTAKPLPVSVTAPFPAHMKDTLRIKGSACQLSGARAAPPGAFLDRSKRRRTIAPKPLPRRLALTLMRAGSRASTGLSAGQSAAVQAGSKRPTRFRSRESQTPPLAKPRIPALQDSARSRTPSEPRVPRCRG